MKDYKIENNNIMALTSILNPPHPGTLFSPETLSVFRRERIMKRFTKNMDTNLHLLRIISRDVSYFTKNELYTMLISAVPYKILAYTWHPSSPPQYFQHLFTYGLQTRKILVPITDKSNSEYNGFNPNETYYSFHHGYPATPGFIVRTRNEWPINLLDEQEIEKARQRELNSVVKRKYEKKKPEESPSKIIIPQSKPKPKPERRFTGRTVIPTPIETLHYISIQTETLHYISIPLKTLYYTSIPTETLDYISVPIETLDYISIVFELLDYVSVPIEPLWDYTLCGPVAIHLPAQPLTAFLTEDNTINMLTCLRELLGKQPFTISKALDALTLAYPHTAAILFPNPIAAYEHLENLLTENNTVILCRIENYHTVYIFP